jgi:shikimate kinase
VASAHLNALGRHLALAGFMGSGKSRSGGEVARGSAGRSSTSTARSRRAGSRIADLFAERGESGFRELEERSRSTSSPGEPAVVALGGGAVLSERTRDALAPRAFTVLIDVEPDVAWQRVSGSDRPLAQSRGRFHALHRERQPVYEAVADARATDVDGILLAAAGVHVELGALDRLDGLVPGDGPVELVVD